MGCGPVLSGGETVGVDVTCPCPWPFGSEPPFPLVLYDACPKSLRSGVWWPQTKFGILASVPCPRGALGEYLGSRCIAEGGGVGLSFDYCGHLFS